MKPRAIDIQRCFQQIFGTHPWRVKVGVGSFLTFEFGPRSRAYGHVHGKWHLWIYLSNWALFHGHRRLVDSDSDRKMIAAAMRRLEEVPLTGVKLDGRRKETKFLFDDFRLIVSPADYLENASGRDAFWIFFMPDGEILSLGPSGLHLERKADRSPPAGRRRGVVTIPAMDAARQIRFED